MPALDCPFRKADELLGSIPEDVKIRIVDLHAEATSEKQALGWYLDGRVTAVRERTLMFPPRTRTLLPQGTAYLNRPRHDRALRIHHWHGAQAVIQKFLDQFPARFEVARATFASPACCEADPETGRALSIQRILRKQNS